MITRNKPWFGFTHPRDVIISFVVIAVILLAAEALYEAGETWYDERRPIEDWVEYHAIGFVEEDPLGRGGLGSLRMFSDTTIHEEVQLDFTDTLRCANPKHGGLEFVSQNPATEAFVAGARERRTGNWLFNADYPRGIECQVDSTITVVRNGVTKRIVISTQPFVVD